MSESCLVSRLGRYVSLTAKERALLREMEREEQFRETGKTIVHREQEMPNIYVLKEGWAVVRSVGPEGRLQILRVFLPGEIIGLAEVGPLESPHEVVMQLEGVVCPFPRRELKRVFNETPRLAALFFALSSLDQISLRDRIASLGLHAAEDRIIHFLLDIRARLAVASDGLEDCFHLPFSQAEIGQAVALTPVYVNRLLRRMIREERIAVDKPYISLMDRRAMERQVGFTDRYHRLDNGWFPDPV